MCGSYLPRDDPNRNRQPKLVITDPKEIEVVEQLRKPAIEATRIVIPNSPNGRPGLGRNGIEESVRVMRPTADLEEMWEALNAEGGFGHILGW